MSQNTIPEYIDPYRSASQHLRVIGIVPKSEMKRLDSTMLLGEPNVDVDLQFGMDEQDITFLKGHLKAKLTLQCQRCLEHFVYEIMSDFALGIVNTLDEAKALPKAYEPALAKDGKLAIRELIEDELILNLPIIPKHEPKDCVVVLPSTGSDGEPGRVESPFRVLESLKNKQK